jgi:hypothetical protein
MKLKIDKTLLYTFQGSNLVIQACHANATSFHKICICVLVSLL